ncbi:MAG: alpha/beta fold hydrolase [Leptolyngbyaceae cyanobacterium SL_7_1]|nr:alpha/beta fold hydrolase [Leptolyngbyaceae cyanobacterium SL_7_1]
MTSYIYLHGFASSPNSAKVRFLQEQFDRLGLQLQVPDLNQGDFFHLTLTRQIHQVEGLIASPKPVTLIGSSFGGLTAAWLAERNPSVQHLILLAPAFNFVAHWLPKLGAATVQQWQQEGSYPVYHYGAGTPLPLSYNFVTDAQTYNDRHLQRPIPTLIFHGQSDEIIPIAASRAYGAERSWVQLVELESDHMLTDALPEIWQKMKVDICQDQVGAEG